MLRFQSRHGVEAICAPPPVPRAGENVTVEEFERLRERIAVHGIDVEMIFLPFGSVSIEQQNYPNILLGKDPDRDHEIDQLSRLIRTAGKAGIHAASYNLTVLGGMRTEPRPGRGGSRYLSWELKHAPAEPALTAAGVVPADLLWERITYFLERIVPVAAEAKVRLACHPNDPPLPPQGFRGVQHVLDTVEGLRRFVSIAESDYHGLNFCIGAVAQTMTDPAVQIYDVVRDFGQRGKIVNVHFRNIRGRRDDFQETYPDEGDLEMPRLMRLLIETGYSGMVMPDHTPMHAEDHGQRQAFAYAYGYIRGLLQSA
jgi:mannonate dehydratase